MALAKTELFHALLLGSTILYKNVTFVVRTSAPECAGSSAEASDELDGVRNNNFSSKYVPPRSPLLLLLMPLQRVSKMCIAPPTIYAVQSAASTF